MALGSIISPLLFLIMINDLPNVPVNIESSMFVDDSAVFKSGKNIKYITEQVQKNLGKLEEWCDKWGFKVSMDKTVAVLFCRRVVNNNVILKFNGNTINTTNRAKFLGIIFDSKLTWSEHISYNEGKCKKHLNLMRSVADNTWGACKKSLLTIYGALIRSILDYGSVAFDSAFKSTNNRLDSIGRYVLVSVQWWQRLTRRYS